MKQASLNQVSGSILGAKIIVDLRTIQLREGSVVEVNPLCRQRQSLLAQIGSSNNQTKLTRRFLIANDR